MARVWGHVAGGVGMWQQVRAVTADGYVAGVWAYSRDGDMWHGVGACGRGWAYGRAGDMQQGWGHVTGVI